MDNVYQNVLAGVMVWDNGGKSWDRYTVLIDRDVYGMSSNADSVNGFNQYIGDYTEFDFERTQNLGKRIKNHELPFEVIRAIYKRIKSYEE